jgi:succinate dehydrogenase flavin-adding protein (antitoxin of CptAB toxin-antitoxin module)
MNLFNNNIERKNKLKYHASYRGCKENELVLRKFCDKFLDKMNNDELTLFEEILNLEDPIILDYLYSRIDIKSDNLFHTNEILRKFIHETLNKE